MYPLFCCCAEALLMNKFIVYRKRCGNGSHLVEFCGIMPVDITNDLQDYIIDTGSVLSLLWCHNGCVGVSNHQPHDCLLNRSFRRRSKKTSKLRVTGLCVGNSPAAGEFPAQMASNAENVSIGWRHHVIADNMGKYVPGRHCGRVDSWKSFTHIILILQ